MLCNHSFQDSCLLGCCTEWHTMCYNSYQELQQVLVQLKHFRLSLLHHSPLSFCTSLYSNVSILPRGVVPANQWQKLRNSKQKFRNLQHCQHHMPFSTLPFWIIIAGETLSKQFLQHLLQTLSCFYGLVYDEEKCWYFLADTGLSPEIHTDVSSATDHKILTRFEVTVQVDGTTTGFL